ncbi:hypothetical protein TNCV_2347221 [Trichonephila clavipes]|nr:hypothetical protein TNCV_2347221 [Trichonephila clavipes]
MIADLPDLESRTDSEISIINDSGSIIDTVSSDDFDFDISDDESDGLSQARNFYEIDCNNPSCSFFSGDLHSLNTASKFI